MSDTPSGAGSTAGEHPSFIATFKHDVNVAANWVMGVLTGAGNTFAAVEKDDPLLVQGLEQAAKARGVPIDQLAADVGDVHATVAAIQIATAGTVQSSSPSPVPEPASTVTGSSTAAS